MISTSVEPSFEKAEFGGMGKAFAVAALGACALLSNGCGPPQPVKFRELFDHPSTIEDGARVRLLVDSKLVRAEIEKIEYGGHPHSPPRTDFRTRFFYEFTDPAKHENSATYSFDTLQLLPSGQLVIDADFNAKSRTLSSIDVVFKL